MAGVGFDGVWKEYDSESIAVKDLTIEVESGEFVVLVGPSGCGKTTSLRMLAGLEEITEGTITIDGVVVNDLPPKLGRDESILCALPPHECPEELVIWPAYAEGGGAPGKD